MKLKRSPGSAVTMMHITEDTPPDMLAGAMDLTVHLPTGRSVKMSVERSTPMMDLLVQIVTAHQLQLSGHTIQALEMAPAAGMSDKVLPYKPNTPIGALDTQHIKVVPKNRNIPASKSLSSGHQPFESTFRLKVHLPRNQLYVTRVSQNIYLEDIMNKVCKEKNLDPLKYEFRHPGNLDEVLDPKLTLSDYQITEIYVVSKGTGRLSQAFSTSDIMALRKEEERKQFQAKTGGGVFNLIFKRGKSNPGNGSISSDNRSISPSHSDDSRSVTPPGIQPPPIIKEPPPSDRPKPPQRKRRPAPKPPQVSQQEVKPEKPPSQISNGSNQSDASAKKAENGLLICHSRNSSDSSGYHEASILSDNCNTSLPRRPKTMIENEDVNPSKLSGEHSRSTGNLTKSSLQYKSTSSLALNGRKKKAAPPPPPLSTPKLETSIIKSEITSPVVASQPVENLPVPLPIERSMITNSPIPAPRRNKLARRTSANQENENQHVLSESFRKELLEEEPRIPDENTEEVSDVILNDINDKIQTENILEEENNIQTDIGIVSKNADVIFLDDVHMSSTKEKKLVIDVQSYSGNSEVLIIDEAKNETTITNMNDTDLDLVETNLSLQCDINPYLENTTLLNVHNEVQSLYSPEPKSPESTNDDLYSSDSFSYRKSFGSVESLKSDLSITSINSKGSKPEIVGVIPKKRKQSNFDTLSRKRGFHIGSSLINIETEDETTSITSFTSDDKLSLDYMSTSSKTSDYSQHINDFEMNDINEEIFKKSVSKTTGKKFKKHLNELHGMHELDFDYKQNGIVKNQSISSLKSMDSIPGFMGSGSMKKWGNTQDLDDISVVSSSSLPGRNKWVVGDGSDTESVSTVPTNQTPPDSISSSALQTSSTASAAQSARTSLSNTNHTHSEKISESKIKDTPEPSPLLQQGTDSITEEIQETEVEMNAILAESKNEADSGICEKEDLELETVWQYQLPSPPKAFRDASPTIQSISQYDTETLPDSVVTNPELFEKLQYVKDIQDTESDIPSVISEEEKEICNKLTLEHLEKRKSLVYNRELATSLKFAQNNDSSENNSYSTMKSNVLHELEGIITNTHNNNSNNNNNIEDILNTTTKTQESLKAATLDRNLPNFQISSYDTKKEKINIFEDDTIRSNTNISRSNSQLKTIVTKIENTVSSDSSHNLPNLQETETVENVSSRKNSESADSNDKNDEEIFKKPLEVNAYRLKNSFYDKNRNINANLNNGHVSRSGSFSVNTEGWTPQIPVKRSKSQIALNKYKEDSTDDNIKESLSRSNSLLDVSSSLQSLEVMKKIQNKLSNSKEELDVKTDDRRVSSDQHIVEQKLTQKTSSPHTNTTTSWTPPSINLGTWSERPKTQVTLKEDTDYKFSTKINAPTYHEPDKLEKTTTLKSTSSFSSYKPNTVSINNSHQSSNGVSIKVNGNEAICPQKSGNVVIKIGGGNDSTKEIDSSSSRFINHITPEGYRKPLGNVNKIDRVRPHSIAFDNQFDISRVPVVRSVELKKPFKDLQNKSITQIYSNNIKINDDEPKSLNYSNSYNLDGEIKNDNKHSNVFVSNESINKPVFRNNSFTPVVKGFRTDGNASVNRKTWSVYGTLPMKPIDNQNELNTNRNVPFSQMNLRRTESNKVLSNNAQNNNNNSNVFNNVVLRNTGGNFKHVKDNFNKVEEKTLTTPTPPPPPPQLPKENNIKLQRSTDRNVVDPRAELLSAIRNFGGKKGLRASKG